jgi:hypothetical protein
VCSNLSRVPLLVVHLIRFRPPCARPSSPETLRVDSGNGPGGYRIASVAIHCGASIALLKIGQKWVLASDEQLSSMTDEDFATAEEARPL